VTGHRFGLYLTLTLERGASTRFRSCLLGRTVRFSSGVDTDASTVVAHSCLASISSDWLPDPRFVTVGSPPLHGVAVTLTTLLRDPFGYHADSMPSRASRSRWVVIVRDGHRGLAERLLGDQPP
jgi:hypothetical protein